MKQMVTTLGRGLFLFLACMAALQARAADSYNEFVADIYQLQSIQTRNPEPVIAYADGKNGALLRSILAPERFAPQLEHFFRVSTRTQDKTLPNLMHAIKPVIDRYDAAFKANPKKYEAEYLDSLENGVMILIGSNRILEQTLDRGCCRIVDRGVLAAVGAAQIEDDGG